MNKFISKHNLFYASLILLPVFIFISAHYLMDQENTLTVPTGFFNGESPYYMANVRQYIDEGFSSLFYSNPFSYLKEGQRVYFQFQTFFLAIIYQFVPVDAGAIWVSFGLVFSFLLLFTAFKLFETLGISRRYIIPITFLYAWGGGIHGVVGFCSEFFSNGNLIDSIKALEKFEIADGWWMHSVGRNFLMPNYIYYHFLVMTGILFISNKSNKFLIALCFILSFSHPFVGAQFIATVVVWLFFEKYYLNSIESKYFSFFGACFLLLLHVSYYFLFLKTSSEHVAQEVQWSVSPETLYENWAMRAKNFIPSYIIVFSLFFYQIRTPKLFLRFFSNFMNRFLFSFGLVSFTLANHEFLMKPIQPIHFTHGMVWFPFFILGRNTLVEIIKLLRREACKHLHKIVIVLFFTIFLFDNFAWVAKRAYQTHKGKSQTEFPLYILDKEVIEFVNKSLKNSSLVFVEDLNLGYHLAVYTSSRVYASHNIITPDSLKRKKVQKSVILSGKVPEGINEKEVFIIREVNKERIHYGKILFQNKKHEVISIN